MSILRSSTTLIALVAAASSALASQAPTLEQRLDVLADELEAARVEAHVPGMSIAIVKEGELVFARGFGLADVETERAANEETIYAIGSTTKAFTATLVGMLADEGKLTWDDPVTRHLPAFELAVRSEDPDASCTLRDLLSHRHGFARMSILWFGGRLSRAEVLEMAAQAEPWDDFRKGFHYCNVTYMAAGEAAGVADGTSWETLMSERILQPLGMQSSTLTVGSAQEDERLALGYAWDELREAPEHKPMVPLDNIGPAGSVNANVLDMAQWLRLQLGRGEVDGMRLISQERLEETWRPQIEIAGGVSYGLGWMLREHDGRQVVEHGGNIDGFSAQVTLVPSENTGYVLLMNLDAAPLQQASIPLVLDALFDEWVVEAAASSDTGDLELEQYEGIYLANFATFQDEEFEVSIQDDGGLALDIPSQQLFALNPPDAEGKWQFSMTDQIEVSFDRGADGEVVGLVVHQAGFTFEVPREGVELAPEVPAEVLEPYVGTFDLAKGGKTVELAIRDGRLTMIDKGQLLAFHTPDAEGFAQLRARAEWGATFGRNAEGAVDSFVFHGQAGDRLFKRSTDLAQADVPSLEDIDALRGLPDRVRALEAAGGVRAKGSVWIAQAGARGTIVTQSQGKDRMSNRLDFGKLGIIASAVHGDQAWTHNPMQGFDQLEGKQLAQARLELPGSVLGDWREHFTSIDVLRSEELDGRKVHVVRLGSEELPSRTYFVDAETGDVLRVKQITLERSIRIPVTIDYSNFVEQAGVRRPAHIEVQNPMSGRTVMDFDDYESGLELPDSTFRIERPEGD